MRCFAVAAVTACAVRRDDARVTPMGLEFTTFVRWNSPFGAAEPMYSPRKRGPVAFSTRVFRSRTPAAKMLTVADRAKEPNAMFDKNYLPVLNFGLIRKTILQVLIGLRGGGVAVLAQTTDATAPAPAAAQQNIQADPTAPAAATPP